MPEYKLTFIVEGRDQASGPLGAVGLSLGRIAEFALGDLLAGGLRRIGDALMGLARNALNSAAEMQNLNIALGTLAARELATAAGADSLNGYLDEGQAVAGELMKRLRTLSLISPFTYDTIAQTFRQEMAFGATSDQAMKLTDAVLNVGAGLGLTGAQMERFTWNLNQAMIAGDLTAANMRQLRMVGFDLMPVIRNLGFEDAAAAVKAFGEGTLTSQQLMDAFVAYAESNFGGAAQRMTTTWTGLKSSITDLFTFAGADLLTPALEVVTAQLGTLFNLARGFVESGQLAAIGQQLAAGLSTALSMAQSALPQILAWAQGLAGFWSGQLSPVVAGFSSLFAGFAAFWEAHGPAIREIAALMWQEFVTMGQQLVAMVLPFIQSLLERLGAWFVENGPLIQAFLDVMAQLWNHVMDSVIVAWSYIQPILGQLFEMLLNLATLVMQVVTGDWAGAWQTAQDIFTNFVNIFSLAFLGLFDWIAHWLGSSWADIKAIWQNNWNMLVQIVDAAIGRVKGAFQGALDWIKRTWNNIIGGLRLPSWMTPGSPTPLELGLRGIADAFASIGRVSVPAFAGIGPTGGTAVGSTIAVQMTLNFGPGSVRSDADIYRLSEQINNALELRGLRQAVG